MLLTSSGLLVEQLKEIIPPLAHRLLILKEINQKIVTTPSNSTSEQENDSQVSNTIIKKYFKS